MSPPWWDGTIAIPFTMTEWDAILIELKMLYAINGFPNDEYDLMLVDIMNRIEKGKGVELDD